MTRLCVVGIGSPFGQDTLGWEAITVLEQQQWADAHCEVVFAQADRPGPKLLEIMAGETAVVVIDAMRAGSPPGTICLIDGDQLERYGERISSHGLGVADVLAIGAQLGDLPDQLWLIGIEVGRAPHWEQLVELVQASRDQLQLRGA